MRTPLVDVDWHAFCQAITRESMDKNWKRCTITTRICTRRELCAGSMELPSGSGPFVPGLHEACRGSPLSQCMEVSPTLAGL